MVILGELKWITMHGYLLVKETRKRKPKLKLDVSSMKNNVRNKKTIGTITISSESGRMEVGGVGWKFLRAIAIPIVMMASLWLRLLIGSDEFPIWFRNQFYLVAN